MADLITFPSQQQFPSDLTGRRLALNISMGRRFQTRNFWVSASRPVAIVEPTAFMPDLIDGLKSGALIDVTGAGDTGISMSGSTQTAVQENDDPEALRVFLASGPSGVYCAIPESLEQQKQWEKEIAETGTLKLDYESKPQEQSGVSPIIITDLEE